MQKKYAFTIFETLMVLAITAVLIILSLKIFRNAEEKTYASLYSKAFKTLNTATYNIQKDVDDFNAEKDLEYQEQGQSGAPDSEKRHFPNISCGTSCDSTVPTPEQLCTALASDNAGGGADTVYGYINATDNACNIVAFDNLIKTSEIDTQPSFRTTDGMKYYITDKTDSDFLYVWVDINGDRRPNKSTYEKGKKKPDIVPFIISKENGIVVPQGLPVYDSTYMTARVISGNPDLDKDYSIPMTYYEAHSIAYSSTKWELDKMSVLKDEAFKSTFSKYSKPSAPNAQLANDLKCKVQQSDGYVPSRDFPPCTIEVSTFTQK